MLEMKPKLKETGDKHLDSAAISKEYVLFIMISQNERGKPRAQTQQLPKQNDGFLEKRYAGGDGAGIGNGAVAGDKVCTRGICKQRAAA